MSALVLFLGQGPLLAVLAVMCLGTTFALVLFAGFGGRRREDRHFQRRMAALKRHQRSGSAEEAIAAAAEKNAKAAVPHLDRLVRRHLPRREALQKRLARTGRRIGILEYIAANLILALLAGFAAAFFGHFPALPSLLAGLSLGLGLPHLVIGFMGRRRRNAFINLFPEAIDLIVRGLKSGLPVSESIATVGQELADPVGIEFRRIDQSIRFGQSFDEALGGAAERLDLAEFRFFVISLGVQRETGGNLAETLENLSDILRRRRQMQLKVKAMSAEARASAMIVGALPFVMFAVLMVVDRDYVMKLFHDPRGNLLLGAGLLSMAIGTAVMAKLVRFEI